MNWHRIIKSNLLVVATALALLLTVTYGSNAVAYNITYGYSVWSGNEDGADDSLYRINLSNGIATRIGPVGFYDVSSLAFHPWTNELFGFDDGGSDLGGPNPNPDRLIRINTTTGLGTNVGLPSVPKVNHGTGMAFDRSGNLFLSDEDLSTNNARLYSVNTNNG